MNELALSTLQSGMWPHSGTALEYSTEWFPDIQWWWQNQKYDHNHQWNDNTGELSPVFLYCSRARTLTHFSCFLLLLEDQNSDSFLIHIEVGRLLSSHADLRKIFQNFSDFCITVKVFVIPIQQLYCFMLNTLYLNKKRTCYKWKWKK